MIARKSITPLNQAAKEISTRYDFRNVDAGITWSGDAIVVQATSEDRVRAAFDVFQSKLICRGVSLKAIAASEPATSGKLVKMTITLKQGIDQPTAKKISQLIRDEGPKGVKVQIQGDELRVSSKKRDDLQDTIALVKAANLDVALQYTNYR